MLHDVIVATGINVDTLFACFVGGALAVYFSGTTQPMSAIGMILASMACGNYFGAFVALKTGLEEKAASCLAAFASTWVAPRLVALVKTWSPSGGKS